MVVKLVAFFIRIVITIRIQNTLALSLNKRIWFLLIFIFLGRTCKALPQTLLWSDANLKFYWANSFLVLFANPNKIFNEITSTYTHTKDVEKVAN